MPNLEKRMSRLLENVVFGVPKAIFYLVGTSTGIVILAAWALWWCFRELRRIVISFGGVIGPIAIALDLVIKVIIDAIKGILAVVTLGFYHPHFDEINVHDKTGQVLGNMTHTEDMCSDYKNAEKGIGEIIGLFTQDTLCADLRYIYPSPILRRTVIPLLQWASLDPDPNGGNCAVTARGVYCTFIYGDSLMMVAMVVLFVGVGVMSFNLHEMIFDALDFVFFVGHALLWLWEKARRGHRHSFKEHWLAYKRVCAQRRRKRIWHHLPE